MESHTHIASSIVALSHTLYARGYVAAYDGNVSARLPSGNILITPSAVNKGNVTEDDILEVTPDGVLMRGSGRPSTELGMHLTIYHHRQDVFAVVHAHPPYATGFAAARKEIPERILPEVIVGLGRIPLASYATPSTQEVGDSLLPFVGFANAILLTNHGVVAYGSDLEDAYFKLEKVEHAAHIAFVAHSLGGAHALSDEEVERLRKVSEGSYGRSIP